MWDITVLKKIEPSTWIAKYVYWVIDLKGKLLFTLSGVLFQLNWSDIWRFW